MKKHMPRILIVDDIPSYCEMAVEFLANEGYELETAADGIFAWEMLE